jgi:hypothetical protein
MPENSKELDDAIRAIETRFRIETLLMKWGCNEEAAKLIASSPDQIKKFVYDGVDLRFGKSDLPAADDPNVKAFYTAGPFKALFTPATDKANGDGDHAQPDPELMASARNGNRTSYSKLARDSFNGDVVALDKALAADKTNGGDGKEVPKGHGRDSKNPFYAMRPKGFDSPVDPAIEKRIGEMIRVMGHRKVADIARAATSEAAPLGLSLTGLPLKVGNN